MAVTRPCVIASVVYGSELAPEAQFLREFRDQTAMSTFAGSQFMRIFNAFYYSFSPSVAQRVGESPAATLAVRALVYPLLASLRAATSVSRVLSASQEVAILVAGILGSCLTGTIYLLPSLVVVRTLKRRLKAARGV